jgi:hypothetical protein
MSNEVEIYLGSKYGESAIRHMGQTGAAEYAAASFAGIYPTADAYAEQVWQDWSEAAQADCLAEWDKAEADAEMFGWMAEAMSAEENGVVEFVTTDAGVYVYDEALA